MNLKTMPNTYDAIRPKIRSGQMLAWTHREWKTWYDIQVQAVRVFTQSEFCHVGITWKVEGRVFVIEAVKPCVRIFELSKLLPFYWLPVDLHWDRSMDLKFLLDMVGTKYPSNLRQIRQNLLKHELEDDGSLQCAELVHKFLAFNGLDLGSDITPSGLVRAAQSSGIPCLMVK